MSNVHYAFIHPFQLRLQRGIEVYLWNLSVGLVKEGIQVDILTWDGSLAVPNFAQIPGITILRIPKIRYFQAVLAIPIYFYWLITKHYDHIFVHFAGYGEGIAINLTKIFCKINFSIVFHFPRSQVPHRYKEYHSWHLEKHASHLIAVSDATAREAAIWSGRHVEVIGHGVNTRHFSPNADLRVKTRNELGIPTDAFVLITVAALEERKGVQWGIQALKDILSVYYLVIGDGPYLDELIKATESLNLRDRVIFMGAQLDVKPYLAASDLSFLLAYGEAFGISILEYAAMELPVITSHHEPFPELVKESWGFLVDEKKPEAINSILNKLQKDPNLRKRMGKAARDWAIHDHDWNQIADTYIKLINSDTLNNVLPSK